MAYKPTYLTRGPHPVVPAFDGLARGAVYLALPVPAIERTPTGLNSASSQQKVGGKPSSKQRYTKCLLVHWWLLIFDDCLIYGSSLMGNLMGNDGSPVSDG